MIVDSTGLASNSQQINTQQQHSLMIQSGRHKQAQTYRGVGVRVMDALVEHTQDTVSGVANQLEDDVGAISILAGCV